MGDISNKSKIIMVTGKGGVGKSTYSLAIAKKMAQKGLKTLLVEVGKYSYFSKLLQRPAEYTAQEVEPNLYWSQWVGEDCLEEYVGHLVKITKVAQLFFNNPVMKTFVDVAPGLKELAITGKLTSGIRNWGPDFKYDRIVFDGFATGHFLALLHSPKAMGQIIKRGPMGKQSRSIMETLQNPNLTEVHIINLPEELPSIETSELHEKLRHDFGIKAKIITNKCAPLGHLDLVLKENKGQPFLESYLKQLQLQDKCLEQVKGMGVLPFVLKKTSNEVCDDLVLEIHWDN